MNSSDRYPREEPDRRTHVHAPDRAPPRRGARRYLASFLVNIHVGEGQAARHYTARAWDISDGGLALQNVDIPEGEQSIRLDFDVPAGAMPEEYVRNGYHLNGHVVHKEDDARHVGIRFEEPLSRRLAAHTWAALRWGALIALFLTVSAVLLIKYENIYYFWFDVPIFLYGLAVGTYLLTRFLFAAFYRPPRPRTDTPRVSVVVPAYNEEHYVERTLTRALELDYPPDRLQVIAVNDGSSDGTLARMMTMRERYPELAVVDLGEHRGKRHAMATGTRLSTGEIIVFIDSDSFLDDKAVLRLVDGFTDPEVAAVCGHCEVENEWDNLLTRMQAVRYYIGFRVMKGAESIFNSVTCLSGPLAAYRRTHLLEVIDAWQTQTFLGQPATYGDDRSLTNFLLRRHKVLYDSRARTRTIVPSDYRTFFAQQMRWKRSWFRESMRAGAFIWRKEPLMWLSFYLGLVLPVLGPAIVFRALLYVPLFQQGTPFMYMFGILLMSVLMSSTYLFAKRSRLWIYGIPFCFFYMFVLVWQLPVAILSFWIPRWGTRD